MKALCVRDALSDRVIRVSYGERPVDVRAKIAEKRATHAVVFQDDKIRGVVLLGAIGLWKAERPFGDLLPELPVRIVPEHARSPHAAIPVPALRVIRHACRVSEVSAAASGTLPGLPEERAEGRSRGAMRQQERSRCFRHGELWKEGERRR